MFGCVFVCVWGFVLSGSLIVPIVFFFLQSIQSREFVCAQYFLVSIHKRKNKCALKKDAEYFIGSQINRFNFKNWRHTKINSDTKPHSFDRSFIIDKYLCQWMIYLLRFVLFYVKKIRLYVIETRNNNNSIFKLQRDQQNRSNSWHWIIIIDWNNIFIFLNALRSYISAIFSWKL